MYVLYVRYADVSFIHYVSYVLYVRYADVSFVHYVSYVSHYVT